MEGASFRLANNTEVTLGETESTKYMYIYTKYKNEMDEQKKYWINLKYLLNLDELNLNFVCFWYILRASVRKVRKQFTNICLPTQAIVEGSTSFKNIPLMNINSNIDDFLNYLLTWMNHNRAFICSSQLLLFVSTSRHKLFKQKN